MTWKLRGKTVTKSRGKKKEREKKSSKTAKEKQGTHLLEVLFHQGKTKSLVANEPLCRGGKKEKKLARPEFLNHERRT